MTFGFFTLSKRTEDGGINFQFSAGKEIELMVGGKQNTITFTGKVEDITHRRERGLYGYI